LYRTEGVFVPVVLLNMRKGFSTAQKRKIASEFTNTLVSTLGIERDLVTILIDEHELENIAHAGKLRCD
jgi:4-oxalocrotonate tautomerase family enzyme